MRTNGLWREEGEREVGDCSKSISGLLPTAPILTSFFHIIIVQSQSQSTKLLQIVLARQ